MSEWEANRIETLVVEVSRALESHEIVAERGNRCIVRVFNDDGTIIVKFWARPELRGALRRCIGATIASAEFRALQLFVRLGVPVPDPLGFALVPPNPHHLTEAVVMSDLGTVQQGIEYFKHLARAGEEAPIREFENHLIDITMRMIRGGVLDFDHGLINMVVPASGYPIRLDLEHARVYRWHSLRMRLRARMLGHLLLTHLYAVQPESALTEAFSLRLFAAVPVPSRVLTAVEEYVKHALERQRSEIGLRVSFDLPRC